MLNAKQIEAAPDRKTVEVHVPEWETDGDDVVLVGTMGALDYAALQDWIDRMGSPAEPAEDEVVSCDCPGLADEPETAGRTYTNSETFELMVRWCVYSILDPQTQKPAFTIDQVQLLGNKSLAALERIYRAALDLNRVTKKATEEFEKNLERTAENDSGGG